jgi:DNA (cytosine-5)-methyltransferase 1
MKNKVYKTIDLFAGIGGIRKGFEKAGFETIYANDVDPYCKVTYDLNFNNIPLHIKDIKDLDIELEIPKHDVLTGGFPCQAFSIAGYREGFKDKKGRGNLFFYIEDILKIHKPEVLFLENVKNLQTHDNGNTYKVIKSRIENLGYKVKERVLNSMDYGAVPQNRERIYIVGFLDHSKADKFEFPNPIKLVKKIKNILEPVVDEYYYYYDKPLMEKLKEMEIEEGKVYQWRRVYLRENKKDVCPTLTANMGTGGHNVPIVQDGKGVRKLTLRECLLLQGFDKSYKIPEDLAKSKVYKQIGNSVTVSVIERIAENIRKVLD